MSRAEALRRGREAAEKGMTDVVIITRAGTPTLDEATGTYPNADTTIYKGKSRLRLVSPVVRERDAQGQFLAEQSPRLDLPVLTPGEVGTSAAVEADDVARIIASENDPGSVGLSMTISGVFFQTDATARRFPVEVQT